MNAHTANLVNAFVLIAMGAWGYFGNDLRPPTALIPVFFGVILMVLNNGVKYDNKVIAHIAVVLTLVVLVALFKPFLVRLEDGDTMGIIRTGAMILTSFIATVFFIKSFIDAKKARKAREAA